MITINSSLKEFKELEYFKPSEAFNGCVIIPTGEKHHSGYMCMKFALMHNDRVVGCVGGYCDIVHINGIGGYGMYTTDNYLMRVKSRRVPLVAWCIDCLPNGLLRLFSDRGLTIDDIICSDFQLYAF